MDRRVTTRRPTSAFLHTHGVVGTPDEKLAVADLLEMAFQTEVRIAHTQQLGIDGAVDIVTGSAPFAQGVVLEGKGAPLGRMAAEATFILG